MARPAYSGQDVLDFPFARQQDISSYLPPLRPKRHGEVDSREAELPKPFLTLTYASSLDAQISLTRTAPTALSGPETKAMTHYLRANHDGILIGVGTAIADDPTLNSRIREAVNVGIKLQPRPIILDRNARWEVSAASKMIKAAKDGRGKGPWILVDQIAEQHIPQARRDVVEGCGGAYIVKVPGQSWLSDLRDRGIKSVMVEGGGKIINDLLAQKGYIDALIITLAPVFLGVGGVRVSVQKNNKRKRARQRAALHIENVKWVPMGRDVVMCGKVAR